MGALAPLETTGLTGTLGAVQSRCVANPSSATGTANIADTKLQLDIAGTKIDLVEFPANPNPNTKVLTDLDEVLDAVIDALRVDINNTLDGLLAPLQAIIDPVQDQLVDPLIAQIADQLGPLEENILDAHAQQADHVGGWQEDRGHRTRAGAAPGCRAVRFAVAGLPRARDRDLWPEQPRRRS